MCLVIDSISTIDLTSALEKKKFIHCWKVYRHPKENTLYPIFFRKKVSPNSSGFVISNRKSTILTDDETIRQQVDKGIHVFTSSASADNYYMNSKDAVLKVKCYKEDFVAASRSHEAVFKRIQLPPNWVKKLKNSARKK